MDADIGRLEQDLTAIGKPPRDQILHHFLLAVDGDALTDQIAEADVVQRPAEGEITPLWNMPSRRMRSPTPVSTRRSLAHCSISPARMRVSM